ncbi:transcription initiation factor TFIID subunit 4 isoform X2 [Biomphalaria glabrata]|nr:transcription initiation factor TFIID subunit 4 isoform X2 [Biomphalaria glabrata]
MRRGGVKSFVDDLVLGRGVVISRAATSLRSVETQPLTRRFVSLQTDNISDSWSLASLCTVTYVGERILQVRLLPRAIITLRDKLFYGSG